MMKDEHPKSPSDQAPDFDEELGGFNPVKYEAGTNVLRGTKFFEEPMRTTDWYFPAESKASSKWEEKWLTLRTRFERLVDQYRPVESVLVQIRVPAHARDSVGHPPRLADNQCQERGF